MIKSVENINIGDHVAIIGYHEVPEGFKVVGDLNGRPFRVLAISYPFLAVHSYDQNKLDTIDVRRYQLTKLNDDYVALFAEKKSTMRTIDDWPLNNWTSWNGETGKGPLRTKKCPDCGSEAKPLYMFGLSRLVDYCPLCMKYLQ